MKKLLIGILTLGAISVNASNAFTASEAFEGDSASIEANKTLRDYRGDVVAKKGDFVRVANDLFSIKQFCISKGYKEAVYADIRNRGSMPERDGTSEIGLKIDPNTGAQSIVEYYDPYVETVKAVVCGNL